MTVGAVILLCTIIWFVSAKNQAQKDQLAANHTQITQSDKHTDSVQIRTDSSKAITAKLDSAHDIVRRKIKIVHDTVLASNGNSVGKDSVLAVSPEIAALIQSDDSLIAAQKRTLALQDTLIASLRVGLNLRDQRITILEKAVLPSKASRFIAATRWIAVGAVLGAAFVHK